MLRKLFFWLHLSAGSLAGIVILIMSVTGVLLAFERQIIDWADRGYRHQPPAGSADRVPVETLIERVLPIERLNSHRFVVRSDPEAPTTAEFGRERV